jgi:hypothetical protein
MPFDKLRASGKPKENRGRDPLMLSSSKHWVGFLNGLLETDRPPCGRAVASRRASPLAGKRMNVVLLVVDSLRGCSLAGRNAEGPPTPFLDRLGRETTVFRRAFATECWTLPSHCSMFTGLLPSEHGAHFGSMAYAGTAPTLAQLLAGAGWRTEIVTRNFVFDGTIPGVTRGFQAWQRRSRR